MNIALATLISLAVSRDENYINDDENKLKNKNIDENENKPIDYNIDKSLVTAK
jgi:hypothetical protein